MHIPPLALDLADLCDAAAAFAKERGLSHEQRVAVAHEMGVIVGQGETSYARALEHVCDFMDDRAGVDQRVAELADKETVCRKPAEQLRWDLEQH